MAESDTDTTTWLSQEAYDRLREELEELKTEGREQVAREIQTAREHGDISENAEYDAAKEKQGQMEARIRNLEQLLREARIGEPEHADEVAPGLVVTVTIDGDEPETYLLGSREDSHDEYGILSAESPIGRAITGHEVGDTVDVETPGGSFEVTVEEIRRD